MFLNSLQKEEMILFFEEIIDNPKQESETREQQ